MNHVLMEKKDRFHPRMNRGVGPPALQKTGSNRGGIKIISKGGGVTWNEESSKSRRASIPPHRMINTNHSNGKQCPLLKKKVSSNEICSEEVWGQVGTRYQAASGSMRIFTARGAIFELPLLAWSPKENRANVRIASKEK